jgi:vitamin B12 transporter
MRLSGFLLLSGIIFVSESTGLAQNYPQVMPEVVVTANRTPTSRIASGSSISVVTSEELSRKQTSFVADVFRDVPGISLSRTGPAGAQTQVRMRGTEANHTLVLIDGVEVNDPSGASEFDFNTLLADDIERVEFLRGPQSSLYGSDAIGGVINVITKSGDSASKAVASAEGGSFGTGKAAVSVRGSEGIVNYSLGLSEFSTEGVSFAPENQGNTEQDGFNVTTFNTKIGIQPTENLEFELVGRYVESEQEFDELGNVGGLSLPVDSQSETKSEAFSLGLKSVLQTFEGQWEHILGVGISEIDRENFGGFASTFKGDKQRVYYQSNVFVETSALAEASHVFTFLVDNEIDAQDVLGGGIQSDVDSETTGFVGEYKLDLFDQIFLSASIRHDENDLFKNSNTVRTTGAYVVKDTGTRLHASYGEGVKNPTLFELFGFAPGFTPNPNLKSEKSYGWDVGVEQEVMGGTATFAATYFENNIKDLIQGAGATAVNLNGKNKIDGAEFEVSIWPTEDLSFSGQYTYTRTEDANGIKLIRRPKHVASLRSTIVGFNGDLEVNLGGAYHGKQDDTAFQAVLPFGSQTVTLDSYILADANVNYKLTDSVSIFGRLQNILNERYENVFGTANPGFGAFMGLRVQFGG